MHNIFMGRAGSTIVYEYLGIISRGGLSAGCRIISFSISIDHGYE